MVEVLTHQFRQSAQQALGNAFIQRSLKRLSHFHEARAQAMAEIGLERWEALRERARQIKAHTIEHLDHYLSMLAEQVERHGGRVCWAQTAHEANEYVLQVARRHGARVIIKSKSMVSEEMGLTHLLEEAGMEPVETDLGEYIIQLARERPFHIIAPAIHKSKEQVADLFVERLGAQRVTDIPALAGVARRALREKFIQADMGITGVNLAVAETGTIAIVTNEGNGRMCTSMPKVHIAVMGMEKVIPCWEDLPVFLALLTRAATGQRISSYVTFVTGPRRSEDEDGPEEFHLVILDNGRRRLLEDPELREALYCIRCGACLNACPVYGKVGGHAYGWVYPGPIGSIVTPMLVGLPKAKDLPYASSLCGACREVCPLRINIPHMLLALRHRLTEGAPRERKVNWVEKVFISGWLFLVEHPWAFATAGRLGALAQRPFLRNGRVRWLPPPLSGWTRSRDFLPLASRPFRERWKALARREGVRP